VTSPHHDDRLIEVLSTLPAIVPGDRRAAQIRSRCRERLERSSQPQGPRLEPLTVGAVAALCVTYALVIVRALTISSP